MIEVIQNNPFRVLGLPAIASEKEITKRISELEVYIKMSKVIKYNADLPFLGELKRTSETIQEAANKIDKLALKLFYSLYWFEYNDENDKSAFEELKKGNVDNAIKIWRNNKDVKVANVKQFLEAHNLSVLYLGLSFNEEEFNEENFSLYFTEISKILNSNYLKEYVKKVAGEKYFFNRNEIVRCYFDEICKMITKYLFLNIEENREYIEAFIDSFSDYPKEVQRYISDKYTKEAIKSIEKEIESCRENIKKHPEDANDFGFDLFFGTEEYLLFLKSVLSTSDIRYQTIADKLAEEILECSTAYWNIYINSDDDIDPGEDSLELSEYADSIAVGERLKERIAKDLETTQNWVGGKEEREKQKQANYHINCIKIETDDLPVLDELILFDDVENYPTILKKFISNCSVHLIKLKEILGILEPLYWDTSNSVVDNALNLIIEYTNKTKNTTKIVFLLDDLAKFDMSEEIKKRFYKNMEIIESNHRLYLENIDKLNLAIKKREKRKKWRWTFAIPVIIFVIIILTVLLSNNDYKSNISKNYHKPVSYNSEKTSKEKPSDSENHHRVFTNYLNSQNNLYSIKPTSEGREIKKESKYKGNQLKNGTSPYNYYFGNGVYNKNHHNEITFKNGYSTDAIVCLVNRYTNKTIRNEYIRKGTNFRMTNIPNGIYYIKVFSGNDWNPEKILANGKIKGGFDTNISFSISNDYSDLLKLNDDGYKYSVGTITLYQVVNGNMQSEPIGEQDFFK